MKCKGFTLFTALVSFVLIVLSIMLVQGMINAERARIETITAIEEQAKMQEIADHERNDALQLLVYDIRFELEDYFNRETAIGPLCYDCNFDELVKKFAESKFGSDEDNKTEQLAAHIANNLSVQLDKKVIGSYLIEPKIDPIEFKESLKNLIKVSAKKENFFKVIECENGDPKNCIGTFYISLRLGDLSEEEYEALPRISVTNTQTGRVLQVAVLPRGNFKIYTPLRFFKAVAEARALILEYNKESGSEWQDNKGLFSPRIHNELEELKLGMCDPGICRPRDNPYVSPSEKNYDKACPNNVDSPNLKSLLEGQVKLLGESRLNVLRDNIVSEYNLNAEDDFKFLGADIKAITVAKQSKIIESHGGGSMSNQVVAGKGLLLFSNGCPVTNTGVWLNDEKNKIKGDKFNEQCNLSGGTYSWCAEIESVNVVAVFNEENPIYMVNKIKPVHNYSIFFKDNYYSTFTPRYTATIDPSTCALSGKPSLRPCNESEWTCKSTPDSCTAPSS